MESLITVGQLLEMIARYLFGNEDVKIEFTDEYHTILFTPNGDHNRAKKLVFENNESELYFSPKTWEEMKQGAELMDLVNAKYSVLWKIKSEIQYLQLPNSISCNALKYRREVKENLSKQGLTEFKQFRDFCKVEF